MSGRGFSRLAFITELKVSFNLDYSKEKKTFYLSIASQTWDGQKAAGRTYIPVCLARKK
jgi:hypothetical protein